jgi:hypothetical protein
MEILLLMLQHYTANEEGRKTERQKGRRAGRHEAQGRKARGTREEGRKALSPRLEALK